MSVKAFWKMRYQVDVRARHFKVLTDEPRQFSGDDTGMMPTELFLSSLASCFCLALIYAAGKRRIEVEDMEVEVEGEKDVKNFQFTKLIVKVESTVPTRTLEGLIEEAKKYCFVSRTIKNPCPIEYVIV
ncbi:MAG: OsmC family protein [Thermodesulfobacteriota bacterium]